MWIIRCTSTSLAELILTHEAIETGCVSFFGSGVGTTSVSTSGGVCFIVPWLFVWTLKVLPSVSTITVP